MSFYDPPVGQNSISWSIEQDSGCISKGVSLFCGLELTPVLVAGTDSPNPGTTAGASMHRELTDC